MAGVRLIFLRIIFFLHSVASLELNYSLLEESEPNDHVIGNIAEDCGLFSLLQNADDRKYIRFQILSDSPFSTFFRINQTSSDLYNSKRVDRESIDKCTYEDTCLLPLVVVAQSESSEFTFFQQVSVEIIVLDINDNPPFFQQNQTSRDISESSVVDSLFPLDGATDIDKKNNVIQRYELLPLGSPFSLRFTNFVDGSSSLSLVLDQKLDREEVDKYELRILAIDGGTPALTGTLNLTVNVLDENDNKPVFAQSTYRITVNENVSVGSTIFKLNATDKDIGDNGKISYQLSRYQPDEVRRLFAITEDTGFLTTSQSLMYTPGTEYRIIIEASDNALQPLTSQVVVYVSVLDSLNDPPEVHVNFLTGTGTSDILESTRVGSAIAHVAVDDKDTGENGDVSCHLQSDILYLQIMSTNEYKIILNSSLDRETQDIYNIVLICKDNGSPSLNSTKRITLRVTDVNDNAPEFSKITYFADVYENNNDAVSVFEVKAIDRDVGDNAKIQYTLVSGNDGFSIDQDTGAVYVNFHLDRETKNVYDFVIMASDSGDPQKSTLVNAQLNILDRNDNKPVFDFSIYTFTVEENRPVGLYVGNVSASDLDIGLNGKIEYLLIQNPDNYIPFRILPDGSIFTTEELDRESNLNGYNFKIYARDKGTNVSLNTSCHVTVFVSDVNDNAPAFVFPNAENYTLIVIYDVPKNSIVGKIEALDRDFDMNAKVTYSVINEINNPATKLFSVDAESGDISLTQALTRDNIQRYVISVNAEDSGYPKMSTNQSLVIVVTSHVLPVLQQDGGTGGDSYLLIAVVISCVTVIVAGIIVLCIFLIRRHDRNKNKPQNPISSSAPVNLAQNGQYDAVKKNRRELTLVTNHKADDGSESRNGSPNTSQEQLLHQRQGSYTSQPSYCEDEAEKILDRLTPETRESFSSFCPSNGSDPKYRRGTSLTSFSKHPIYHSNKGDFVAKVTDNHSEYSVESNTSDSGRGGSDCEVHSNGTPTIPEEHIHMPNPTFRPQMSKRPHNQSKESVQSEPIPRSIHFPQIPEYANIPCNNINNVKNHINLSHGHLNGRHQSVPSNNRNCFHVNPLNFRRDKEMPYLYHKHKPSVHWRHDMSPLGGSVVTLDEDGSTTTSGSYTVDDSGNEYAMTVV